MAISNMLTTIVIGVSTGLIVAAIVAIVNIKIKYAQSEAHAKRSVALIFWKIIYSFSLLFVALIVYKELSSSEPLTRSALINILLGCFTLFLSFLYYLFLHLLRIIEKFFDMGGYVDNKLIHMIMNLPCQPTEIKQLAKNDTLIKEKEK
jgi:hypothetical protein